MKAKIVKRGNLAFIETELKQVAVIPWDTLCAFLAKYHLEPSAVEGGQMPKCVEVSAKEPEVEVYDDQGEDESDEDS